MDVLKIRMGSNSLKIHINFLILTWNFGILQIVVEYLSKCDVVSHVTLRSRWRKQRKSWTW